MFAPNLAQQPARQQQSSASPCRMHDFHFNVCELRQDLLFVSSHFQLPFSFVRTDSLEDNQNTKLETLFDLTAKSRKKLIFTAIYMHWDITLLPLSLNVSKCLFQALWTPQAVVFTLKKTRGLMRNWCISDTQREPLSNGQIHSNTIPSIKRFPRIQLWNPPVVYKIFSAPDLFQCQSLIQEYFLHTKNKEVNLLSVFVGVTADHYVNHITWNALQAQLIFPIREILLVVVITAECSVEKARVTRENKIKWLYTWFCSPLKEVFVFKLLYICTL